MTMPAFDGAQPESDRPPYVLLQPYHKDPVTGALYLHKDYVQAEEAWAEEAHRPPVSAHEKFADLTSWGGYVSRYAEIPRSLITWSGAGLRAVLDYHTPGAKEASRTAWIAEYPFVPTPNWRAWSQIATGQGIAHAKAVEFLDDHLDDVEQSQRSNLINVLRKLRASTSYQADTELRPDGTAAVSFKKDDRVQADSGVDLPPEFEIVIPVMRGHVDVGGAPIAYKLVVKLRASIVDARLQLRFSIPKAEEVMEQVYGDLVGEAHDLLPAETPIYRTQG